MKGLLPNYAFQPTASLRSARLSAGVGRHRGRFDKGELNVKSVFAALIICSLIPAVTSAGEPSNAAVTIESYYRLNWGAYREWIRLYDKNEAPVLEELKRQGLILSYSAERPFTHMAGADRWDFRVRVTYRDPEVAVATGGTYDKAWAAAVSKLFPKTKEREAEERQRTTIIEEHWDVIVMSHAP